MSIQPRSKVRVGVVPTHIRFVGGLVPDERGQMPRAADGTVLLLANLRELVDASPVSVEIVQLPLFPGVSPAEFSDLCSSIRDMHIEPQAILMLGGGSPMRVQDEDNIVGEAKKLVGQARDLGIQHLSSTSLEVWMEPGARRLEGDDYVAAVAQIAKVHSRIYEEAELEGSSVKHWHIEFLRKGEFSTFTNIRRGWDAVRAANAHLGIPFFKVLVDAAHCGDSELNIDENAKIIAEIGAADELGVFHASAKTTRGCLSTDDGWIGALLHACASTGKLETALVEAFAHDDDALAGLRELDPRHGVDTTDGRSYNELVIDGLVDVTRRLNNLAERGILQRR